MAAESAPVAGEPVFDRSPAARLPDRILKWGLTILAGFILALIAFFFVRLAIDAKPAFQKFGIVGFVFDNDWNVAQNQYGAWALVVGTIITSVIALAIGVPIAVAAALYIAELSPRRLSGPLTILVELLAAVPSVVY